jgi:hypothetical protein
MNANSNIDYDKQIQELQTKKKQQELEIKIKSLITEKLRIKQEIKTLKGELKQLTTTDKPQNHENKIVSSPQSQSQSQSHSHSQSQSQSHSQSHLLTASISRTPSAPPVITSNNNIIVSNNVHKNKDKKYENKNRHNPHSPADMVNQNTRFIYKQNSSTIFTRYCLIDKAANQVVECDETGKRIGTYSFNSLNEFCCFVKSSLGIRTNRQNVYDALLYYDIATEQYKKFKYLEKPNKLN